MRYWNSFRRDVRSCRIEIPCPFPKSRFTGSFIYLEDRRSFSDRFRNKSGGGGGGDGGGGGGVGSGDDGGDGDGGGGEMGGERK